MKTSSSKRTLLPVNSVLTLLIAVFIFSVAVAPALADPGAGAAGAKEAGGHTVLEMIMEGGPLIMTIWVAILATSITMVTLVIQNYILLRKDKVAPPALVKSLAQTLQAGNYQEAWEICNANNNYLANVLKTGLERVGRGKDAVEGALAEAGLREAQLVRTRNSYLSVIGVVAPMIGLLGTVIGMMGAFSTLGQSGIADTRKLATSIGEVLLATASGLFIAIPAFIFYYIFRNKSQIVIVHADDRINSLVEDIPFEELQGVKIGENFSAGEGAPARSADGRKVSMSLTTNCPVCNGAITAGVNPCPHCGAPLQWAQ